MRAADDAGAGRSCSGCATGASSREGNHADLVVFDPETVATGEVKLVDDLPGGTSRLFADSIGVQRVIVNGRPIVVDGALTGALPGTVLRSGRDTYTVTIPAGP